MDLALGQIEEVHRGGLVAVGHERDPARQVRVLEPDRRRVAAVEELDGVGHVLVDPAGAGPLTVPRIAERHRVGGKGHLVTAGDRVRDRPAARLAGTRRRRGPAGVRLDVHEAAARIR